MCMVTQKGHVPDQIALIHVHCMYMYMYAYNKACSSHCACLCTCTCTLSCASRLAVVSFSLLSSCCRSLLVTLSCTHAHKICTCTMYISWWGQDAWSAVSSLLALLSMYTYMCMQLDWHTTSFTYTRCTRYTAYMYMYMLQMYVHVHVYRLCIII